MFSDALPNFVNIRSPRVRMGLGTIARVVASGEEIYARKLRFAEAKRRVEGLYHPYHHALRRLVGETETAFGGYLLIDCHSMPSAASEIGGQVAADIVLGDCHGAACAAEHRRCRALAVDRAVALSLRSTHPMPAGSRQAITATRGAAGMPCRSRSTAGSTWTSAATAKSRGSSGWWRR